MLEVTVVLLIIGAILSVVIPSYVSRLNQAKYEKTVDELTSIAQASIDYFNLQGNWPDPTQWAGQLAPQFMPHAVASSPFGTGYNIDPVNDMVTAYVFIPAGVASRYPQEGSLAKVTNLGSQDKIEITRTIQNEFTSRLKYSPNSVN